MANRRRTSLGDPRLKALNAEVVDFHSKKIVQVIQDLIDTMHKCDLIGIAAPQIGENYQIFITEPRKTAARPGDQTDELRVYINPKIVSSSHEQTIIYEGCGSVPGNIFGPVMRPKTVTVEAFGQTGHKFRFTADGILGRVIQHEFDHLQGIEFTQKVHDYSKLLSKKFYYQSIKQSPAQIQASIINTKEFKSLE